MRLLPPPDWWLTPSDDQHEYAKRAKWFRENVAGLTDAVLRLWAEDEPDVQPLVDAELEVRALERARAERQREYMRWFDAQMT